MKEAVASGFDKELKYTVKSLQDFLLDSGQKWDWDDFTSCPLRNVDLNSIRKRALSVELPLDDEGRAILENLLEEAQALAE